MTAMHDHSTLLRNLETFVKNPHELGAKELAQILMDLSDVFSERCGQTVLLVPVIDHDKNRALIIDFESAVQGTNQEPQGENNGK